MNVFGTLPSGTEAQLRSIIRLTEQLPVTRRNPSRSSTPQPTSTDLEQALLPVMLEQGFAHHTRVRHPRLQQDFEYDFFHTDLGLAIEIMGYRADDEVYKDLLKFHVDNATHVGVLWVPTGKWVSGKVSNTNLAAALKALAFADSYLSTVALAAVPYDWIKVSGEAWALTYS